ncbi:MAG: putative zinc-binding metallopeptidase [Deltaproteobacteria bacterium]|nr:putative zinc-binding metallopeptidase [Deltaproteobacteria bacterium]
MKLYSCTCKGLVFFENVRCTGCDRTLAFLPDRGVMSALEPVDATTYVALSPQADGARYRLCKNSIEYAVCNWAVPASSGDAFCFACNFNEVIPDTTDPASREAWHRIELNKRRLFYTLMALALPLLPRSVDSRGLGFAFKRDVMTGHADGLVTINIAEADTPTRERLRENLAEHYRTLLGHLRHEVGHYYWSRLIDGSRQLDAFRALFGDERADYGEALKRHYECGPPADWSTRHVSAYSSMHPWEDWAETWAHYCHMVDTLETARSYGLALRPAPAGGAKLKPVAVPRLDFDDFNDLVNAWVPLTLALNSLNRSMGLQDLYPFVLSNDAIAKLRFVHDTIERPH